MNSLSNNIRNGQQVQLAAGSSRIAINDVVEIGGPGNGAWTVATADYAGNANAGTLLTQTSVVAAALPAAGSRQPMARDRLGNFYVAGTNSSGYLVAYKFSPVGVPISSATLDATATSVNNPQLFQLQSGAYACVYARASGALYFVVFDAALSLISGPISVGTERAATNVVYHSACVLSGGGFAIAYQTAAGTAINLVTYSNVGATVQAATSIATLAGGAAQEFIKLAQLSSGNLVCVFRGTMTASAIAGTSFVVVTTAGVSVVVATSIDSTATLGFIELDVLTGFFAVAVANGTNLICAVYNNAGVVQGSPYSVGDTLNSTSYPQTKLINDGIQFWLCWFSSAANGLYVISLSTAGAPGTAATGLGVATLSASTYALDVDVINGLLVVLAASSATAGQYWMTVALPDASLGTIAPSLRTIPTAFGSAAATTGTLWPKVLSGGGGLYLGSSPPSGQPTTPAFNGDFTAILGYAQQSTAGTFVGIQKVEASAVVGLAQAAVTAGLPGTSFPVNPGQGEYPSNPIGGSPGIAFNHIGGTPAGTAGVLYSVGVALAGLAQGLTGAAISTVIPAGTVVAFAGGTLPLGWLFPCGQAISRVSYAALFAALGTTYGVGDGSTTFNLPDVRGRVVAAADALGGTPASRLGSGPTGGITGGAVPGAVGGEQSHVQTTAEMVAHTHSMNAVSGSNSASTGGPVQGSGTSGTTGSTGSGTAANITQPTIVTNYIIKT